MSPCIAGFQSEGGDVKPKMNYESEFIREETRPENGLFERRMINLSSFIAFHARRTPDRCALKYRGEDISYADFDRRIGRSAAGSPRAASARGDVVAVLMKNSAAFLELVFATSHIGAVFLPINYRLSADEVGYIVGNAGARMLIADEELAAIAAGGAPVVLLDEAAQAGITHLAPDAAPAADARRRRRPDAADVHLGHDRPTQGRDARLRKFLLEVRRPDLALGINAERDCWSSARSIMSARSTCPASPCCGRRNANHPARFRARAGLAAIEADRLDAAWLAPVMTTSILTCPDRDRYDVSSLRWAIGGSEKTPETRIRAFSQYFTNARYIDAYGLTESVGGDTFMEPGREIEKIGSTGRAIAHVEIEIRDDDGKRLPPARTAKSACAARRSRRATGRIRRRRRPPSSATGSAPAMSAISMPTASSI